ncbi:hypothetical protein HMPREF1624_05507 [Sporothrix schenckii ATCC 58251]|uniref:Essential protein Yae1 N-terminal domain-containing protein n=1 Tax=Sporothrix schenckii (strain ATCC 58251 / de Perez 2211183) TaxID=1391915 RepID=U7PW63_SPOS1|nr:hypothetical protein HMPREF1624_05507 [Sporothrix schenckii ATCC 58251]
MATNTDDPFNDLFSLEDDFYEDGFRQGHADGERAGKIEGRTLGLENGFKKFVEAGRLQGKAVVWSHLALGKAGTSRPGTNARLLKNLRTFYALVEPGTLPTANTDEAVNDVDDRVKRAQAKARVLEKMVVELSGSTPAAAASVATTATPEASS